MVEAMAKVLEEASKKGMELVSQHYQEIERSKKVLDWVQTTYQTKVMEYEIQVTATAKLIKNLENKKEATEDKVKMGIKRIPMIVEARRDETKIRIVHYSIAICQQWSKQAAELQLLQAHAKNQKKEHDNFYMMDEESIVTIQEDLLEGFYALANTQNRGCLEAHRRT